jgi:hypothetical protein
VTGALQLRIALGLVAGAAIAWMDIVAFGGEVTPIVIVALLLGATAAAGALWGRRGWPAAAATWACVPGGHVLLRLLGRPDTIHPDTWGSVLLLAGFTLVVATLGSAAGMLVRRIARSAAPGGAR